jgi:hypothetical protein
VQSRRSLGNTVSATLCEYSHDIETNAIFPQRRGPRHRRVFPGASADHKPGLLPRSGMTGNWAGNLIEADSAFRNARMPDLRSRLTTIRPEPIHAYQAATCAPPSGTAVTLSNQAGRYRAERHGRHRAGPARLAVGTPHTWEYCTIRISALRQYFRTPADVSTRRLTGDIPGVYLRQARALVSARCGAGRRLWLPDQVHRG